MDATLYYPVRATWKTPRMLCSNSHFNQLPGRYHATVYHSYVVTSISSNFKDALVQDTLDATVYHCYVVTSMSSNFEDALDVTFQEPFQSTSRTLWMLRCKIHFEQLGRRLGCYVPTAISINFQDTMDATVYHSYVVTSISSNFEDALDVTFQEPFQATSRTLWMLRCTIQFEQLGRRLGCYVPTAISINFQDAIMLRCTIPTL